MRSTRLIALFVLALFAALIAACAPTAPNTPTPTLTLPPTLTLTPSDTPTPRPTATDIPTLPPTWTPVITATLERATAAPSATFTATVDANPTLLAQATRVECAGFAVDFERSASLFTVGTAPTIYWLPARDALTYRLTLLDDRFLPIFTVTGRETQVTFDADLFEAGRTYSWDVRPLDVSGNQMCVSRGFILTPTIG